MRNLQKVLFFTLMIALSILTLLKYNKIIDFKQNSINYTIIIEADEKDISNIKANIQDITYQQVAEEKIEDGKYKIKIKCPPERFNSVKIFLKSKSDHLEIEDDKP